MTAGIRVDVVIPVHDRWELTESCLRHLQRQTVPHTVFVCDNGSTDGTPEQARAAFPGVRVVELASNLGFSIACNRGARLGEGDVIVLLNNDVDCRQDFLERLVAPLDEDQRIGSVAGLLLFPGEERIESFGLAVDPTLAGFPRLRGETAEAAQATDPVLLGPSGAGGAYRRSAWQEVGGLDEGVVSYGEDVDLALRLRAAGWRTAAAGDAVAIHLGSASATTRSEWQRFQAGFARGYFLRRYGVLTSRRAPAAVASEAIVVAADTLVFSRDLAALRGRISGWRAARGRPRKPPPPADAIEKGLTFARSLALRLGVFTGRARAVP